MTKAVRPLVVVPALNEQQSLPSTLAELHTAAPGIEVVVIDDGSRDGTAQVARDAGATVLSLPFNLGVGAAMRLGYRYALANGHDAVVQVDADGQHPAAEVMGLLDALGDADLVVGARFAGRGDYRMRGPRRWAVMVLACVFTHLARTPITDPTSGFKATGSRLLPVYAEHYPAEYLGDTIEALVIAVRTGCRIRQVPVQMRPRAAGQASQGWLSAGMYLGRATLALVVSLARPWPAMEVRESSVVLPSPRVGG